MCICVWVGRGWPRLVEYIYICIHIYIYICKYSFVYLHTNLYSYIYVSVYVFIYSVCKAVLSEAWQAFWEHVRIPGACPHSRSMVVFQRHLRNLETSSYSGKSGARLYSRGMFVFWSTFVFGRHVRIPETCPYSRDISVISKAYIKKCLFKY